MAARTTIARSPSIRQDRAVEQFLVARQRDSEFLATTRRRQQPAARQIGHRDIDHVDRAAMLEAMDFLREGGFKAATQDTIDAQHRVRSLQR